MPSDLSGGTGQAHIDSSPRLLPVDLRLQLQPVKFEHALNYRLDYLIDLQALRWQVRQRPERGARLSTDHAAQGGAFTYSHALVRSRSIARACREQGSFIALSGYIQPHFTTIASFIQVSDAP